jgi:hypothetical protein
MTIFRGRWYDRISRNTLSSEEIAMNSRSTVPESVTPVQSSEVEATGQPHASPNPPTDSVHRPEHRRRQDVDPETGQLRPISAAEWQARMEELTKRLAEIDAQDDTPDEVYEEFRRNFDEEQRRKGRSPVFEG